LVQFCENQHVHLPTRREIRRLLTRVETTDLIGWAVVALSAILVAYLFFATR